MKPSNLDLLARVAELHRDAQDTMDYQLVRPLRQTANVLFSRIMDLPPKGERLPYKQFSEKYV